MLRGLFRTKNLDDILKNIGGPQFALKRTLGAFNVTLIGVGAIIGAGIFATVGSAAAGDSAIGIRLGRPSRTPPALKIAALGFFTLAVSLFTVPHDIGVTGVVEATTTAGNEHHSRALAGVLLILVGFVLGVVGSVLVAKTAPPADAAE